MNTTQKLNVLFIKDAKSLFDSNTQMFNQLFNKVDKKLASEDILSISDNNQYDTIICDLTVEPNGIVLLKKIMDKNPEQIIFALVAPRDSDNLYKIANLNINAFELIPEQFDQALEEIAKFKL